MPRKNAPSFELPPPRPSQAEGAPAGPTFWRSLDELSQTEAFRRYAAGEFPEQTEVWDDGPSRRAFLKLMGASFALAGIAGCARQPEEKIVPYVKAPEDLVPGKPLFYATAMTLHGFATGVLVESHEGRPTKIEGNPKHPSVPAATWGSDQNIRPSATDIFAQASVLSLYDPDRTQTIIRRDKPAEDGRVPRGAISNWGEFLAELKSLMAAQQPKQGGGLRILTETITSPTLASQLDALLKQFPQARWHQYEPVNRDNVRAGARLALGEDVDVIYHFDRADVVLSLDADFLVDGPGHLRHAHDFIARRNVIETNEKAEMNRLYVVESTPTLTGAKADHRLPLAPRQIEPFARALANKLGVDVGGSVTSEFDEWLDVLVDDLQNYRRKKDPGGSLVVTGPWQSPVVHALVHAINDRLGNVGERKTVEYIEPVAARPESQAESLQALVEDMNGGRVDAIVFLGGNPVLNAPANFDFASALSRVPHRIHSSEHDDETSARCHWHIPLSHYLESWSDARAADGTVSIVQPLIERLYDSKSPHELLAAILDQPSQTAYQAVQEYWRQRSNLAGREFDVFWQTSLHEGIVERTAAAKKTVSLASAAFKSDSAGRFESSGGSVEIVFRADPTIDDGRFANNGWLQELPKPLTKLTWDNSAQLSPATAKRLAVENEDVVEIQYDGRSVRLPVWILPGQPNDTVTLHFGYGRTRAGQVGNGTGTNVYSMRTSENPWFVSGATICKTQDRKPLATTQNFFLMEGRDLIKRGTLDQLQAHPEHPSFMHAEHAGPHESFYPDKPRDGYQWGMSINLSACTGCNACVIACQSENNIPVVGKEQVRNGRAMHWLRIDRYYEIENHEHDAPTIHSLDADPLDVLKDPERILTYHQPVPCMHCENAPCEVVCPVQATAHGSEGLNEMVYNRCVGTRYCSNNCPYKVRRFNFLQFSDTQTPVLKLLHNPNVTVRNRGVMEKCTYCVQRINAGRIQAEKEDREIRDGEVITACQAVCPTRAISFGNLNDPNSVVKRQKEQALDYSLLDELNTRPRTTYSAAIRNPNPKLEPGESHVAKS